MPDVLTAPSQGLSILFLNTGRPGRHFTSDWPRATLASGYVCTSVCTCVCTSVRLHTSTCVYLLQRHLLRKDPDLFLCKRRAAGARGHPLGPTYRDSCLHVTRGAGKTGGRGHTAWCLSPARPLDGGRSMMAVGQALALHEVSEARRTEVG